MPDKINQIAKKIFIDAGFESVSFELVNQYHYLASITPLLQRAGKQMALIQVRDDRPTTFFYHAKPYTFTKDWYMYSEEMSISAQLAKSCVESHKATDGTHLYLFKLGQD